MNIKSDDHELNVNIRVGYKSPKKHIGITVIGERGVGKTTCLVLLAELLFELGYHDTIAIDAKDAESFCSNVPRFVLIDNIESIEQAQKLKDEFGVVVLDMHLDSATNQDKLVQTRPIDAAYRVYNRNNLRLFKFELRDLLETQILPKIKHKL